MRRAWMLLLVGGCRIGFDLEPVDFTALPAPVCDAPGLYDVSNPDRVVGSGSPESCTEEALRAATTAGGTIVFDCGPDPIAIALSSALVVTTETVIDGGTLVTLGSQGTDRILHLDSAYTDPTPRLVVQRLGFTRGKATAEGGAIYRDGGSLTVIDSVFIDNEAQASGPDVAGGAIYGFGGGDSLVVGSVFEDNRAANGGAIGHLNSNLTIINSHLRRNTATGTGGYFESGGSGGAIYQDGRAEVTTLCGVTVQGNRAGHDAAGLFRVSNTDDGTFNMERSTVDGNETIAVDTGNVGGLYLQGLAVDIRASSITRNQSFYGGGIWISEGTVNMVNVTVADNRTIGSNGAGLWLTSTTTGTLANCTIAGNVSTGDSVAGAIFGGSGVVLRNSVVANNSATFTKTCNVMHGDGATNLQWPDNSHCTNAPMIADPVLAPLADAGGAMEVMIPAAGSPVIGLATGCPATDQLGRPRGEPCAAGAVEPF